MLIQTKTNKPVLLRHFTLANMDALLSYLHQLSNETKQRFSPYAFTADAIRELYKTPNAYSGFIATDSESATIIAYAIIKIGFLQHDQQRLESYGLTLSQTTDCTFAPSVADAWQRSGVGTALLQFVKPVLQKSGIQRIILWGGVQQNNQRAVQYYLKHEFKKLGSFDYNGMNDDMICSIT